MYRNITCSLLLICALLMGMTMESAYATDNHQLFDIPASKTSEQWSVTLGEPILDGPNMAPKPNVADMYSITIKNNGEKAYNVRGEAYRNEPNSQTKLQLALHTLTPSWENGNEMTIHKNLPISVKANELEVVVYWESEEDQNNIVQGKKVARTWKQSFVFKPNKNQ
jgi:hypothetical protein